MDLQLRLVEILITLQFLTDIKRYKYNNLARVCWTDMYQSMQGSHIVNVALKINRWKPNFETKLYWLIHESVLFMPLVEAILLYICLYVISDFSSQNVKLLLVWSNRLWSSRYDHHWIYKGGSCKQRVWDKIISHLGLDRLVFWRSRSLQQDGHCS